ncbi:hypothetical protein GCM10009547_42300 [Sporichthya brevicatena]|uniref:Secreted protein n=1 Tax=Sporichthya brevicatena TaxID=171442 RepID=A0ABN1H937_9ACTN
MRTPLLVTVVGATLLAGLADPAAADSRGRIKLCVTGGGPLGVFADGPDLRTATLTNKCKGFLVRPGQYYVGIQGYAVPDNCSSNGATVRRGKYSYRAPETLLTTVEPAKTTKITFALDCSLPTR